MFPKGFQSRSHVSWGSWGISASSYPRSVNHSLLASSCPHQPWSGLLGLGEGLPSCFGLSACFWSIEPDSKGLAIKRISDLCWILVPLNSLWRDLSCPEDNYWNLNALHHFQASKLGVSANWAQLAAESGRHSFSSSNYTSLSPSSFWALSGAACFSVCIVVHLLTRANSKVDRGDQQECH